jgi:uncharacterized protein YigE (DUF2233 family)
MPALRAAVAALALWPAMARAEEPCRTVLFEGTDYTVCEARAGQDVRLFHTAADGMVYGTFGRVGLAVKAQGRRVVFAMNAGMYHGDRSPVGLLVESGTERAPIVTAAGPGNFGLRPNGVFCVRADGRFAVIESRAFARAAPDCPQATQSGPMLVIGGALHPRFLPGSDSVHIRNGVGVSGDGALAVFAISDRPVNFHSFARFFRDVLDTPDALYFDGQISRLHVPALGRSDWGFAMGPIVALVE